MKIILSTSLAALVSVIFCFIGYKVNGNLNMIDWIGGWFACLCFTVALEYMQEHYQKK